MGDFENRNREGKIKENTAAAASDEKAGGENPKSGVPLRTYLIMILAGAYVAYLGVSLCQGVMKGAEGSSPGFMVAGVVFIVLGVIFVINGIRGSLKVSKAQKEQANAENAQQAQGAAQRKRICCSFATDKKQYRTWQKDVHRRPRQPGKQAGGCAGG